MITVVEDGSKLAGGWKLDLQESEFLLAGGLGLSGAVYVGIQTFDVILVTSPWGIGTLWMGWPAGATEPAGAPDLAAPNLSGSLVTGWLVPNGHSLDGWTVDSVHSEVVAPSGRTDAEDTQWVLITGPAGIGVFGIGAIASSPDALAAPGLQAYALAANGADLDGWRVNSANDHLGSQGAYLRASADVAGPQILATSAWGIGMFEVRAKPLPVETEPSSLLVPIVQQPNGARLGGWVLDTIHNRF